MDGTGYSRSHTLSLPQCSRKMIVGDVHVISQISSQMLVTTSWCRKFCSLRKKVQWMETVVTGIHSFILLR